MKNIFIGLLFICATHFASAQSLGTLQVRSQPLPAPGQQQPAPPTEQHPAPAPAPAPNPNEPQPVPHDPIENHPPDEHYSFNFGYVTLGFQMYADFTLTANGAPVDVEQITIAGMMYRASTNCPAVLMPGQTCTTRVIFWPRDLGPQWGRLVFDVKTHYIVVDLVGYGTR